MAEAEAFSRRLVSGWRDSEQPSWGEALPRGSSRAVGSRREVSFWFQATGILLTWMALIQETSASGFSSWVPLASLRFDTGDLISCKLAEKFRALGPIYAPGLEHWLLAYDARNLVDIEPNGSLSQTLITVKHVDELNHYKECYKRNNPSLPTEMVKGFVDYNKGKTLYYSLLRCSCKHYTHYWATGAKGGSFGEVSFLPPSRKCIYVLEVNTPASYRETLIPAIPPKEQPQNVPQNVLTHRTQCRLHSRPHRIRNRFRTRCHTISSKAHSRYNKAQSKYHSQSSCQHKIGRAGSLFLFYSTYCNNRDSPISTTIDKINPNSCRISFQHHLHQKRVRDPLYSLLYRIK
ncbi:unnamed protein product [Bemisia tabaci]|uniref:Uncharacterized protein n=1 Tax=Bemisia tabaci TaxID=7038 RepID=A0A9P0A3K6_BEMTA|nr:unnamed protein product [Bemisia tabaci]